MESQIKCSTCGKSISASDAVKDLRGRSLCKECKSKKTRKIVIIILACLALAGIIAGVVFYYQNSPVKGNDQSVVIEEPSIEMQEQPVFNLSSARPIAPSEVGQTIDNIDSFKKCFESNIASAETNNSNNVVIPNIHVLFSFNSASISEEGRKLILEYIEAYKQTNRQAVICISGYGCNLGTNFANNIISKERANAVKELMVSNGISEKNVEVNWYGKTMNNTFNYDKISDYRRVIISIK